MYETQGDQPFTIYPILYNNVTAVSTFMGCDRDLLKDTHTRQRTRFSFFVPPNPLIIHFNFHCIKQIDNIFRVCVL